MSDNVMECDVVIVGAGPAGLSAAIRIKQQAAAKGQEVDVIVLEKGSEVGAHILAGAVLEPRALHELIPDWQEKGAPLHVPVKDDRFQFLSKKRGWKMPLPPQMNNHGNYIISLGNFCRWLAAQAEELGVQIFPGFPAEEVIQEQDGTVSGVRTGAFGVAKDGSHKDSYQEPMEIRAKVTLFGEGCRGSLTKQLEAQFGLREGKDPQTYAIGIKELWEVPAEQHQEGLVVHTIGWPMDSSTYGGGFIYHLENNQVYVGYVIGLDYENPHLNTFKEFQRYKTHPEVAKHIKGGKRISYGARALNEGGFQSIPKLSFPGGAIIGCGAGFVNVPKIKGIHTAMKSGMEAADAAVKLLAGEVDSMKAYEESLQKSWVWPELYAVRNIRPSFHWGMLSGLAYSAVDTYLFRGKAPWTLHHKRADHEALKPAAKCTKIEYPAPDGTLTFDLLSSVYLSNTNHEEDQPCHLTLKDAGIPITVNLAVYDSPESRYCPAGVYEIVQEGAEPRLQINAQNCVHCKSCDIKDPTQNINWVTPEGGGGPNYPNM